MRPVGLVACCKSKLGRPAAARDLYIGNLFRLSVAWLEPRTDGWAILSARHGVVLPHWTVDPYEQTLVGAGKAEVDRWGTMVLGQLAEYFPGREFLLIAGKEYAAGLKGARFRQEFAGLPIGRKMQALKKSLQGEQLKVEVDR